MQDKDTKKTVVIGHGHTTVNNIQGPIDLTLKKLPNDVVVGEISTNEVKHFIVIDHEVVSPNPNEI
ncbi:MAG: hypothetical protein AAFQ20_00070 [Bacteroidota bacterium]